MCIYIYIYGDGGLVTESCLTLVTTWNVALQASLSVGFPRQEYWSGLLLAPPGDLPNPGKMCFPLSLELQVDSLPTEPPGKPIREMQIKTTMKYYYCKKIEKK